MEENVQCQRCGVKLTGQVVGQLCANCMLALALNPLSPTDHDDAEASALTVRTETVLVAATTEVAPTEVPGTVIGRYKLLHKIGEGGMGAVYLGEQQEPVRRQVALKIIKLGMDTRDVIARFEAERQALALMDHPNIARVFDAGATDTGRPYFVMELVRGTAITKYCDECKLPLAARLDLFITICHAISHAHQKGIIHRDIKPSNILVSVHDNKPVLKVIDFGIAKATGQRLTDKTVYTELQSFLGTPAYCSPEQMEMSGLDIDTRSDIYSLGVLLFELLTGKLPFDMERLLRAGLDEMRRVICQKEPPKPSTRLSTLTKEERTSVAERRNLEAGQLEKRVAGDLDWIVMKALEKDRARRYANANEFAQDVQRHLNNEPVVACPPSDLYRFRKFVRRNKLVVTATGAVTAALIVGLSVSIWSLFKEKTARTRAEKAEGEQTVERQLAEKARDRAATLLSVSQAQRGVRLLEEIDSNGLLFLLEARQSVEHLPVERALRTLLWSGWYDSLPKSEPKPLHTTNQLGRVAFCLEREWLATSAKDGQVLLWNANTGALLTALKMESPFLGPFDFGLGGRFEFSSDGHLEFSADGRLLTVKVGRESELWNMAPLISNQPPQRLVAGASHLAFDLHRRFVVTIENERMRSLSNRAAPALKKQAKDIWQAKVWAEDATQIHGLEWGRGVFDLGLVALSPGGTMLVVGANSPRLWNFTNSTWIEPRSPAKNSGTASAPANYRFFPSNGQWLWEGAGKTYQRYDLATMAPVGDPLPYLFSHLLSPDGRRQVSVFDGNKQKLFDAESGEEIGTGLDHPGNPHITAVAFSGDGKRLATAGGEGAVRLWDAQTGQPLGDPVAQGTVMTRIAFRPDGELLGVSVNADSARVYRLSTRERAPLRDWKHATALAVNEHGHVLTHTVSNQVTQWLNPATGQGISAAWENPDAGHLIGSALAPDGRTLALSFQRGEEEGTIRFRNVVTGELREQSLRWASPGPLVFSADSRILGGVSATDGTVQLWYAASGEVTAQIPLPKPMIVAWRNIRFSPDGKYVATLSGFGAWHVWDIAARKLAGASPSETYLAISPDWKLALVSGGLVDISNPQQPRPAPGSIPAPGLRTTGVAMFSPDSRLLAVPVAGGLVRLWDVATGNPRAQVNVAGRVVAMAFSADTRMLLTAASFDGGGGISPGRINVWDTTTGLPCGPHISTTNYVLGLLLDPELRFVSVSLLQPQYRRGLVSGAEIWDLPSLAMPLAEMRRRTWLKSGSRLDESGNIEVISARELTQLEASREASP